ncbi:MAG: DUF4981 domain-containing protein [Oscillospiraceae bacterium]|nr:DUF4981 domain-containing protein [Oscillospiraceae bacterium]
MSVSIIPAIPAAAADPWNESASWPALTSVSKLAKDQKYFTYNEWMGTTVGSGASQVKNADIFGVNRESHRASDAIPYESVEKARLGAIDFKHELSGYYQLLTGPGRDWELTVFKNPELADAGNVLSNFYKTNFTGTSDRYKGTGDVSSWNNGNANYGVGWKTVELPCAWQMQGFDFPIYTNITMPWIGAYGNPSGSPQNLVPLAPTVTNPVGLYRHSFDIPADWMANGKKVYVSFQGVESAMYLYVNGHEVGYTEDSYDAHDFDITPFLNANGRDNLMAVRVHRWCDGSWIEDQDTNRLAGIFRDVFVYATPAVHIRDYKVETPLNLSANTASLNLKLDVSNNSTVSASTYAVDVKLFDANGTDLFASNTLGGNVPSIASGAKGSVDLTRTVSNPRLWSDEDPYLYTLVISLYEKGGKLFECISQQLGFREITFTKTAVNSNYDRTTSSYQQMKLNGKPIYFRGANLHSSDPHTGKYISHELYETDLRIMKQHNLNAIRTSHYPGDRYLYYLADKYGILVMAETNMESHALQDQSDTMANHLTNAYIDRLEANINAQKNRASVVMWSLGNECGDTPSTKMLQKAIQNTIRPLDSTRPVHYEGLGDRGGVDVNSNMYPGVDTVNARSKDTNRMPYVMCEYVFSQGNAVGSIGDYWDAIRGGDNQLGGFIWDYVDKALATPIPVPKVLSVDKSPNGYKAELTGEIIDDADWGKALTGPVILENDLSINNALSGRNPFTFEMVVKPRSATNMQQFMGKGDHQFILRTNSDIDFFAYVEGAGWRMNSFRMPSGWLNNWHHLAAVFDGTNFSVYCDGVSLTRTGTQAVTADVMPTDFPLAINYCAETGRRGDNLVAGAGVYTKALTANEVSARNDKYKVKGNMAAGLDSSILLWMDFAGFTPDQYGTDPKAAWDYYAEAGSEKMAGRFMGYGGSWGDSPNDGSFHCDGIIGADRSLKPAIQEVKYVYQPVWFTATPADLIDKKVTIFNENRHISTAGYTFVWEIIEDGKVIHTGNFDRTIQPIDTETVTLNLPSVTPKPGCEYYLNLRADRKAGTDYAAASANVAYEQFLLPVAGSQAPGFVPDAAAKVTKTENAAAITLTGGSGGTAFTLTVNKATGRIGNFAFDGKTVLIEGPAPNYWRPKADSDNQNNAPWSSAHNALQLTSLTAIVLADGKSAVVDALWKLPTVNSGNAIQHMTYTVYATGEVNIRSWLTGAAGSGELLKFGTAMKLPKHFQNLSWYGSGPLDAYADRSRGAKLGLYSSTVFDEFYPFVRPQVSGNHPGVRYMTLEAPGLPVGLMVVGERPVEAGALPFAVEDYSGKKYPYQMPQTDYTVLNVDQISSGLGCALGPSALPKYRVYSQDTFDYSYTLIPYATGASNLAERSRAWRTAEIFDQQVYDKQQADEVIAMINAVNNPLSAHQQTAVTDARGAYNKLTAAQQAMVGNLAVLAESEAKIAAISGLSGAKSYVRDIGKNGLNAEFTNSLSIRAAADSPTGYAMRGWFQVPNNSLMNSSFSGSAAFTLEAWVNVDDNNNHNTFFAKGDQQVSLKTDKGGLEFVCFDSTWRIVNPVGVPDWKLHTWCHVVGTREGTAMRLYLNGVLIGTATMSGSSINNTNWGMGIGKNLDPNHADKILRGEMAAARAYTRALTAAEIAARYRIDCGKAAAGDDALAVGSDDISVLFWYDMNGYYTASGLPEAPYGLKCVSAANAAMNDGAITGTTAAMEYRTAGTAAYTPCAAGTTSGLTPGIYYIRFASPASPETVVAVGGIPAVDLTALQEVVETAKQFRNTEKIKDYCKLSVERLDAALNDAEELLASSAPRQEAVLAAEIALRAAMVEKTAMRLKGDVDGSGVVNITDARLVLQHLVNKITLYDLDLSAADVASPFGAVDISDARVMLQKLVDKITAWPAA